LAFSPPQEARSESEDEPIFEDAEDWVRYAPLHAHRSESLPGVGSGEGRKRPEYGARVTPSPFVSEEDRAGEGAGEEATEEGWGGGTSRDEVRFVSDHLTEGEEGEQFRDVFVAQGWEVWCVEIATLDGPGEEGRGSH
jgi:hypothetical protein